MEEVNQSQIFTEEQPERTIEVTLEEFDAIVVKKKALDRLLNNPDYQLIVEDDYLHEDFLRLSGFLKSGNIQAFKDRDLIVEKIAAKGYFEKHMREMYTSLSGIDNPEQRLELIREMNKYAAKTEGDSDE